MKGIYYGKSTPRAQETEAAAAAGLELELEPEQTWSAVLTVVCSRDRNQRHERRIGPARQFDGSGAHGRPTVILGRSEAQT